MSFKKVLQDYSRFKIFYSKFNIYYKIFIIYFLLGPLIYLIERDPADLWLSSIVMIFIFRSFKIEAGNGLLSNGLNL